MKPSEWIQAHFYVPEPRDPVTGKFYPPGPIILSELQCRLVDEALSQKIHPRWHIPIFKYTTVIYSTIKKSGKSTLAAAAQCCLLDNYPYGRGFCLANDEEQAEVLFGPIYTCFELHQQLGGKFKGCKFNLDEIWFPNHARSAPLSSDETSSAGREPTIVTFSELHGYNTEKKKRLFAEMTVPPTRFGRAIRWIETYAGYQGVSDLLWEWYVKGVKDGEPHPDFLDITSGGEPVVRTNQKAGLFCYWDHEPRMAWQLGEEGELYYQQEANALDPAENRRLHKNEWVSPVGSFLPSGQMWDALGDTTLPLDIDPRIPLVVSLDAAETNDCAAITAVSRHPIRPETDAMIRAARIFKPSGTTGTILLEPTLGRTLLEWSLQWNIVCVVYDAYQLAKMVQDYRRGAMSLTANEKQDLFARFGKEGESFEDFERRVQKKIQLWYYRFSQQTERTVSDKKLFDMVVHQQLAYNPQDQNWDIVARGEEETVTKHIKQAGAKTTGGYRLVKLSDKMKVDGAVSLSMGLEMCMRLNISHRSNTTIDQLLAQVNDGTISYEDFVKAYSRQITGEG